MDQRVPFTDLGSARRQLLLLATMIFITMYGRVVFSPLLPLIQSEFAIGPARGTRFFLTVGTTYTVAILCNGYVSRAFHHRGTISLMAVSIGIGMTTVATAHTLSQLEVGFALIGVGAGIYPPSGVTSVTTLVSDDIRGRAIAIHELGPNLAFVVAPLLVTLFSPNWRLLLLLSAAVAFVMAAVHYRSTLAGRFPGEPPRLNNLSIVLTNPVFWAIALLFIIAASATLGVYAILPTFLVSGKGWSPRLVNALLSASRISGLAAIYLSGHVIDRFGPARVIAAIFLITGPLTIGLGSFAGPALAVAVFLQPVVVAAFFPAAVSVLASLGPPEVAGLAVSLAIPVVNLVASGIYPTIMGRLAEGGTASPGFVVTGVVMLVAISLVPILRRGRYT